MEDNRIKHIRIRLGLSQERFARLVNVSLQTVRRWENGLAKPLPIISLKLEELQKEINKTQNKGGIPMDEKKGNIPEGPDIGFGGLFKGLGNLFDLVSTMAREGKEEYSRTGHMEGMGGKAKGMYGFSIKVGLGGKPIIEQFGNIKATGEGAVVAEVREPPVDIFDEGDHLVLIFELPGVEMDDIKLKIKEDILELSAEARERKYGKEVLLPCPVDANTMQSSYKNGILEIKLRKA